VLHAAASTWGENSLSEKYHPQLMQLESRLWTSIQSENSLSLSFVWLLLEARESDSTHRPALHTSLSLVSLQVSVYIQQNQKLVAWNCRF
jgi:hypothetical protein